MSQLAISEKEKLENLAEEVKAILTEAVFSARMTLLEAKHLVGKTIAENPLYQKSKKGSGRLVKEVAQKIGRSEQDLYLCIKFYERFRDVSQCVETLKGRKNDITWAAARRLLEGEKEIEEHICEWEEIERCKVCRKLKN